MWEVAEREREKEGESERKDGRKRVGVLGGGGGTGGALRGGGGGGRAAGEAAPPPARALFNVAGHLLAWRGSWPNGGDCHGVPQTPRPGR